jgi:hypothetical protein
MIAAKSQTTKTAKSEAAPLSAGQIKILTALNAKGQLTRKQIAAATGMDQSGFCLSIGYIEQTDTSANYQTGRDLYARGYVRGDFIAETVKGSDNPRDVWYDAITAAGKKALERAKAAATDKPAKAPAKPAKKSKAK